MLWVLTSFESFEALYVDQDVPLEAVIDRLIGMAERLLYSEPNSG